MIINKFQIWQNIEYYQLKYKDYLILQVLYILDYFKTLNQAEKGFVEKFLRKQSSKFDDIASQLYQYLGGKDINFEKVKNKPLKIKLCVSADKFREREILAWQRTHNQEFNYWSANFGCGCCEFWYEVEMLPEAVLVFIEKFEAKILI
jgi:hypothetical protein